MTNDHVLAVLARERQQTLVAQARAARQATHARSRSAATSWLLRALRRSGGRRGAHAGRVATESPS